MNRIIGSAVLGLLVPVAHLHAQAGAPSLESLLNTRISAASKYAQTAAEAPASVTIVTADEIATHRYRNLTEILEQVRGFYVSNDRNYTYVGARGFARPTDYNSRILLLVDGQSINEEVWGGAPMGFEIPINLDAVERIEIIRGPGSALYGTSAMLAVVNVVLKTGTQLDATMVRLVGGDGGEREVGVAMGRAIGAEGSIAISATARRSDGEDLYFPEFDSPPASDGIARALDWERAEGAVATARWRGVTAGGGFRDRRKGIPTGSFGSAFGDPRTEANDRTAWGSISATRELRGVWNLTGRLYASRYDYEGTYPADPSPTAYQDGGGSTATGVEAMAVWDVTSGNRLSLGSEFRHVSRAEYVERQPDGTETRDDQPFDVASVFLQNELQLSSRVTVVAGIRSDTKLDLHSAVAPRAAVIATPDDRSTIKLLYGEAFRSPSPAEATITTTFYQRNPALRPERIRTLELEFTRRLRSSLLFSASAYTFRIHDLIDQVAIGSTGALIFDNVHAADSRGVEVHLDALPDGPVSGRLSWATQLARDGAGTPLTNSPEQIGLMAFAARSRTGLRAALSTRYESGRRTLAGPATTASLRSDMTLAYNPAAGAAWIRGAEISVRVTNLFDERYSVPAGVEHVQTALPQPERHLSLRLDWRF